MTKKDGIIVTRKLTMFPSPDYPALDTSMPIIIYYGKKRKVLDVPVYGTARVRERECSKYVRMAASDLFGKSYSIANAWDRRYKDKLVYEVDDSFLESLAKQGTLLPGMIVGIRNPDSTHNQDLDILGEQARYTHNALYLGNNRFGRPLFAEQFINAINVRTEEDMRKSHLIPVEIIDVKSPSLNTFFFKIV